MRLRLACLLALAAVTGAGGCGGDLLPPDAAPAADGELALTVSVDEALDVGAPVTWLLVVTNGRQDPVTLRFRNGQQGDVVLTTGDGTEAYRWSDGRSFTEALVERPLDAGASIAFELAEEELVVEPGSYQLRATVPSEPEVPPVERTVTVG